MAERLAALKLWADGGAHRAILGRPAAAGPGLLVEVVAIQALELAPEGQAVDRYVIAYDGDRPFLKTAYAAGVRAAEWRDLGGPAVDQPRPFADGQPLFFELWDADYGPDALIGGFAVYPDSRAATPVEGGTREAVLVAPIAWDWKEPRAVARRGVARVRVRFRERPGRAGETEEDGR